MTPSGLRRQKRLLGDQRGSVLVTVLAMLAVMMTILLAVMTYAISRYSVHKAAAQRQQATWLAAAGITRVVFLLNKQVGEPFAAVTAPNGGSIETQLYPWGIHYLVNSVGTSGNQQVVRWGVLGVAREPAMEAAIVCGDPTLPLVVSGTTRIRGTVLAGPLGLTEGRIQGEGPIYEDFHVGGLQLLEKTKLPQVDTSLLWEYIADARGRMQTSDREVTLTQIWRDMSAFDDATTSIVVRGNLTIEDAIWTDRACIRSLRVEGRLEFRSGCRLSALCEVQADAIMISGDAVVDRFLLAGHDSIVIADRCRFSGMALSPGTIRVRDEAVLTYPSELVVYDENRFDRKPAGVDIRTSRLSEAAIVALGRPVHDGDGAYVYVDTVTSLKGYILCENEVDLRGRISGSVMTEHFRYDLPPTTYVNWLKDCTVDRTGLDFTPLLPILSNADSTARVAIMGQD